MFSIKDSDDDDDLYTPNASQNLEHLFNVPMQPNENDELPSLKYVAPKQSKAKSNISDLNQELAPQNKVIIAKRITAYKLINKQYVVQGLLGLALIKVINTKFRIILYKDKLNILSTHDFTDSHKVIIQDLYYYFTDNSSENWSVLFENGKDLTEFVEEMKNTGAEVDITNKSSIKKENTVINQTVTDYKADDSCDIKDTKAKILNLMEKMGQTKLLPEIQSSPVDNTTDSSDNENVRQSSKPVVKPRKLETRTMSTKSNIINPTNSISMVNSTQYALVNGHLMPFSQDQQNITNSSNPQWLASSSLLPSPASNENLNMYICENRIHNSELRMNISNIERKLEKVLDKLESSNKNDTSGDGINVMLDYIRGQTEKHNQEIDSLKFKLQHFETNGKRKEIYLSDNGSKLGDIIEQKEQEILDYKKQINILELKLKDFEEYFKEKSPILKKYEEDIIKFKEQEQKIENLMLKLNDFEGYFNKNSSVLKQGEEDGMKLKEQQIKIENLTLKLKDFEDFYKNKAAESTHNDESKSLQILCQEKDIQIADHEKTIINLQLKLNEFEELHKEYDDKLVAKVESIKELNYKLQRLEETNESLISKLSQIENNSHEISNQRIKSIMNEVYALLSKEIDENNTFKGIDILQSFKKAIKVITLETLSNRKETPPPPPDFDG
ncbi:uncharacterized protein LOC113372626 [Ctenocephalides felis]|uniref:uncharacterized protein LOC113372626 n=1 Tax=Ctenocephalides felis TaxID=7515 RepID=UPI000E6E595B|nr:uncharacterized protein LOC113372626 [Ctenocephalides felis]